MPLSPHPSDKGHRRGRHIEDRLLRLLDDQRAQGTIEDYLQPDAIVLAQSIPYFAIEAKGQDMYVAPPFDGHGLPVSQVIRYEQLRLAAQMRTRLIVWDERGRCDQWLDVLEQGPHFDTAGTIKKPRRIYPIASFIRRAA